ncbi:MAG: hypothetical protein WBC73_00810 [Phormidesmis sp.]
MSTLSMLAGTPQSQPALDALFSLVEIEDWRSRMYLAYALKPFKAERAKSADTAT